MRHSSAFQFYISTIITKGGVKRGLDNVLSILHKYDYNDKFANIEKPETAFNST